MCLILFSSLYKERDREGCTGEENHLDTREDGEAAWCPSGWVVCSARLRGVVRNVVGVKGEVY